MTVGERNALIEQAARELLHERARMKVAANNLFVPCHPFRTWKEYEDANWKTIRTEVMNRLRDAGEIPYLKDCSDYDFMTYRVA